MGGVKNLKDNRFWDNAVKEEDPQDDETDESADETSSTCHEEASVSCCSGCHIVLCHRHVHHHICVRRFHMHNVCVHHQAESTPTEGKLLK